MHSVAHLIASSAQSQLESMVGDFKELKVWQRAHILAIDLYRLTACFPPAETYGLVSQIRRAAGSIPANIAESRGRVGHRDQERFLHIAQGSARELESHLLLARDLGMLPPHAARIVLAQVAEMQRMLSALIYKKR
jgi:four helix bundle protein